MMNIQGSSPLGLSICAALCAGACSSGYKTALIEALQEYNDGIRWQRMVEAAQFVAPAQRSEFAARAERLGDVRVSDYQISGVKVKEDSKAYVLVRIYWYSLRTGHLNQTLVQQTWDRKGERWEVTDQRWVRGKSFPLFAAR